MELRNPKFTTKYTKVTCGDIWKYHAPHHFKVINSETGEVINTIDFQEGPVKEVGINGVANEDLLLMVITRLEGFQNTEYRCPENEEAICALMEAVDSLRKRTVNREARGVQGTSII